MDGTGGRWYESCMDRPAAIPVFQLFGETRPFPDVVHCERVRDRARLHGWAIAPHRHDAMIQVVALEAGGARVAVDGAERPLGPGDFVFVPARCVHGFAFARGTEGVVVSLPVPVARSAPRLVAEMAGRLTRPVFGRAGPGLAALLAGLEASHARPGPFRAQRLVGLAHAILAEVCEAGAETAADGGDGAAHLARLDALVARHMAEGWRPGAYARAMAMTTGHLSRLCRAAAGCGAARYIDEARMTEACRNLAFTRLPVAEIAFRTGFADPAHFSRRFRALRGESPSAYRARFQQSQS